MMDKISYADAYRNVNFRQHPEKYVIGKGEQGVLIAEPYKSEILPYWKFATPSKALNSARTIYHLFTQYGRQNDFVGMDMARKFLQMGFTRSRRYANHASGSKYSDNGAVKKQDAGSEISAKAESARIFLKYYRMALNNEQYRMLKVVFQKRKFDKKLK
jgi:hypothetical protein